MNKPITSATMIPASLFARRSNTPDMLVSSRLPGPSTSTCFFRRGRFAQLSLDKEKGDEYGRFDFPRSSRGEARMPLSVWSIVVTRAVLLVGIALAVASCGTGATDGDHSIRRTQQHSSHITGDVMNFHFDEWPGATSFNDMSGANLNGSCSGSACPTVGPGIIGLLGTPNNQHKRRAARFNGTTNCVTIPHNTNHWMTAPLTMSVWVLPTALPTQNGQGMAFISKYAPQNNNREWILGIRRVSGVNRFAFWKSHDGTSSGTIARYSTASVATDKWTHVIIRIKPIYHSWGFQIGSSYQFWIDGQLDSSGNLGSEYWFAQRFASTRIGCVQQSNTSPDMFFEGKLDEVFVAKYYFSDGDIQNYFSWSKPAVPHMGFWVRAEEDNQAPYQAQAVLDQALSMGMDVLYFFVRRNNACTGSSCKCNCDDFRQLHILLDLAKVQAPDLKVMVVKLPLWGTSDPPTSVAQPPDHAEVPGLADCDSTYTTPEERWACAIGKLADVHSNLSGWVIDDMLSAKEVDGINRSYLNRDAAVKSCNALLAEAQLPVYGVLYCGQRLQSPGQETNGYTCKELVPPAGEGFSDHECWWQAASDKSCSDTDPSDTTTQTQAFYPYMTYGSGATLSLLQDCIKGAVVFTNPGDFEFTDLSTGESKSNQCLDEVRQVGGDFELIHGVYLNFRGLAGPLNTCGKVWGNILESRMVVADGYSFFQLPVETGADSCENLSDPPLFPFWSVMKDLVEFPESYVGWGWW